MRPLQRDVIESGFGQYVLSHLFLGIAMVKPAEIQLALYPAVNVVGGLAIVTIPTGNQYWWSTQGDDQPSTGENGYTSNVVERTYAKPVVDWGYQTHMLLVGHGVWFRIPLSDPITLVAGSIAPIVLEGSTIVKIATGCSNTIRNQIIDHMFRTPVMPVPTQWYVQLGQVDDDDVFSPVNEISSSSEGYARVPYNAFTGGWSLGGLGVVNRGTVVFPVALGDWGLITHYAVEDAAGNSYGHGPLNTPLTIRHGDPQILMYPDAITVGVK